MDLALGQGPSRRDEPPFAKIGEGPCGQYSAGHLACGRLALRLRDARYCGGSPDLGKPNLMTVENTAAWFKLA